MGWKDRTFGRISLQGKDTFALEMEPPTRMKFRQMFNRVSKSAGDVITMSVTPQNCREIEWFLKLFPLEVAADARKVMVSGRETFDRRGEAIWRINEGEYSQTDYPMELPLRDYQQIGVDLARSSGVLLIADDVGLGKTPQGIGVFSVADARPALVVTLTHLPIQWKRQIAKFLPNAKVHILRQTKVYDLGKNRHGHEMPFPDVIVTHYGMLRFWGEELAGLVRTVVYDEAQELRRDESEKYKSALAISEQARFRVGLTATPIYNYGIEIYNVMNALSCDALGSREEFGREWCGGQWGDKAKISEPRVFGSFLREQGLMVRRTRSEVGRELPPCQIITEVIDPDMFHLNNAKERVRALAEIVVSEGGSGLDKMQAAGQMDYTMRRATGLSKAEAIADFVILLLEAGEKVVLFGWHHDVYEKWKAKFKDYDPAWITGEQKTGADKDANAQRFINGPNRVQSKSARGDFTWRDCPKDEELGRHDIRRGTDLLIMSLRAGAGIDGLQDVCSIGVIGELDWSPGVHTQCIGRIFRDGQVKPVLIYVLLVNEGSDPVIADTCQIKQMQLNGIIDPDADDLVEDLQAQESEGRSRMQKLAHAIIEGRKESEDD